MLSNTFSCSQSFYILGPRPPIPGSKASYQLNLEPWCWFALYRKVYGNWTSLRVYNTSVLWTLSECNWRKL